MHKALRIAQVAPLQESVPPQLYGGTERVVSYLTEALCALGHDVTLFASADSQTSARLIACAPRALRLSNHHNTQNHLDPLAHTALQLERVMQHADQFDIIHSHIDFLPMPLYRRCRTPSITTMHGRLDTPGLATIVDAFYDCPLVAISDSQASPLPRANWIATIYHGLPLHPEHFNPTPQNYLAFLGRISPEKRVDSAIQIAKQAGIPLKIAAKIGDEDRAYFHNVIQPMLDHPLIEFVGEISEAQKPDFLGNALALLFMVDWPEPFGLAMIEAMACGTPVIARRCGSVPEVVDHGITGFIVDNEEQAIHALHNIHTLDRKRCHRVFEERFSIARMTQDYLYAYQQIIDYPLPDFSSDVPMHPI